MFVSVHEMSRLRSVRGVAMPVCGGLSVPRSFCLSFSLLFLSTSPTLFVNPGSSSSNLTHRVQQDGIVASHRCPPLSDPPSSARLVVSLSPVSLVWLPGSFVSTPDRRSTARSPRPWLVFLDQTFVIREWAVRRGDSVSGPSSPHRKRTARFSLPTSALVLSFVRLVVRPVLCTLVPCPAPH